MLGTWMPSNSPNHGALIFWFRSQSTRLLGYNVLFSKSSIVFDSVIYVVMVF
jgi:hypothetical protein